MMCRRRRRDLASDRDLPPQCWCVPSPLLSAEARLRAKADAGDKGGEGAQLCELREQSTKMECASQ